MTMLAFPASGDPSHWPPGATRGLQEETPKYFKGTSNKTYQEIS